uniref:NADH dehydrogenase subunit 6 n=1 Tax=Dendropoma petraeum TaxID=169321 RepID=Q94X48_9CAEN|nr:NADH dehydrogenase subunit 6 [Dendropoma petraeum]
MSAVIVTSMVCFIGVLLPVMGQPLSLGLVILCLTASISYMCGFFVSSWYGYILFLVYVGGLLVMFAYVAALVPNVKYSINFAALLMVGGAAMLMVFFLYLWDFMDMEAISGWPHLSEKMTGWALMTKIGVVFTLALVLLLSLIVVVKLCYQRGSALRSFLEHTK